MAPRCGWLHRSKHCVPPPPLCPSWICHCELHVHREVVAVHEVPPTGGEWRRATASGSVPLLEGGGWAAGTQLGLAAGWQIGCRSTDQAAIHIARRKRWWWPPAANHQHRSWREREEELKWIGNTFLPPLFHIGKWSFIWLWCEVWTSKGPYFCKGNWPIWLFAVWNGIVEINVVTPPNKKNYIYQSMAKINVVVYNKLKYVMYLAYICVTWYN